MSVYSHRPVPPPPPGSTHFRVSELLDAVKVEVDSISQEANILKLQRDEYEHKISAQINEMNAFQQNLYELERTHQKVKQQYEDEILRLRRELDQRTPNPSSSVPPHPQHQQQQQQPPPIHQQQQSQQPPPQLPPSQIPQPPNIGPSQSNLFGGIIGAQCNLTVGGTPGGNPSAPLQMQDPQQSQRQQPHLPYGASQIQPIPHPGKRLRPEGDTPPSGQQQQPPSGYPPQNVMNQPPQMGMGMYDGFSSASGGLKKEPPHHGPSTLPGMNAISSATQHSQPPTQSLQHPLLHHPQQPSHPHQLPHTQQQQHGTQLSQHSHQHQQTHPHPHQHQLQHQHHPNSGALQPLPLANNGPVPNQNAKLATTSSQPVTPTSTANAIPTSTSSASSNLISGPGDDISKRKQMTGNAYPNALPQNQQSPQQLSSQHQQSQNQHHRNPLAAGPVAPVAGTPPAGQLQAQGNGTILSVNDTLSDMDPENVPAHLKREGKDWFAIFNPKFPRTLDVGLVHTLDHSSVVCCVRFSHDGKYLATGCNRSAQIYDVLTGHKVCVLADETVGKDGDLYIRSVCFSPDGKYLATGAEDKQIRIWDIGKKRIRNLFTGHEQDIYSLDFSKDGRLVVSGSGDRTARVWDMETGKALHTLSIEDTGSKDAGVTSVAISPDGRLVAAGSLDKMVRVWDAMTGYFLDRLEGHKDSVYSVAFAPEGKCIVSGSLDKTLKMWDLSGLLERTNGSVRNGGASMASVCQTTFVGHKDFVLSVACSPCGNWVVSGSKDRGVLFWDPRTAQTQFMLQGHKNSVISVALSPVGGQFATGSGDCRARIWKHENFSG